MTALPTLDDLGLARESHTILHSEQALRLARTLDLSDDVLASSELPLTWIWAFFTPTAPTANLRLDGHPATSATGALDGLDRRMFAGGQLDRLAAVRLDTATRRRSRVIDAAHKHGGSGAFVLVSVEHEYDQGGSSVLRERQQLVYRAASDARIAPPGPTTEVAGEDGRSLKVVPDERLLFRYSALTFNSHRIHYDRRYATEVEGYPGLVVHGPLTATLLAGHAAAELGRPLVSFSFRAQAPTFDGVELRFTLERAEDAVTATAVRADAVVVMTATASGT